MTGNLLNQRKTIISTPTHKTQPEAIADGDPMVLDEDRLEEPQSDPLTVTVPLEQHGKRLDVVLTQLLGSFSRAYIQQRIEAGDVRVDNHALVKTSGKVSAGLELTVVLRETAQSRAFLPQDLPIEVVYEDEHLLVLNKPAGWVVHPAPGNWQGTLLNALLHRYPEVVNLPRAGIVHRLDKDTSGLMVTAKSRACMDALVKMIADRTMHREYLAIADKPWSGAKRKQVNSPIGRDPHNRIRMAVVDLGRDPGKAAKTDFSSLANGPEGCVVHCILHTGRTHQIRVHMASLRLPLLGDLIYGGVAKYGLSRQALHAFRLSFDHPITGADLRFSQAPPDDFSKAVAQMGLSYNLPSPRDGATAIDT